MRNSRPRPGMGAWYSIADPRKRSLDPRKRWRRRRRRVARAKKAVDAAVRKITPKALRPFTPAKIATRLSPAEMLKRAQEAHRVVWKATVPKAVDTAVLKTGQRIVGREGWAAFGKKAAILAAGVALTVVTGGAGVAIAIMLASEYVGGRVNRQTYRALKKEGEKIARKEGKLAEFRENLLIGSQDAQSEEAQFRAQLIQEDAARDAQYAQEEAEHQAKLRTVGAEAEIKALQALIDEGESGPGVTFPGRWGMIWPKWMPRGAVTPLESPWTPYAVVGGLVLLGGLGALNIGKGSRRRRRK